MTYVTLEINVFNLLLGKEMIKRSILHTVLNKNKNSQSVSGRNRFGRECLSLVAERWERR